MTTLDDIENESNLAALSSIFTMLALFLWAIAQLPQLFSFYSRLTKGASSLYFFFRFLGDILFLIDTNLSFVLYLCLIDLLLLLNFVSVPAISCVSLVFPTANAAKWSFLLRGHDTPNTNMGYIISFLVVTSRCFQICVNYKLKSMTLSVYFILLYIIGTFFYLFSVIIDYYLDGDFITYFPYTFGASLTILLDLFMLYQSNLYKSSPDASYWPAFDVESDQNYTGWNSDGSMNSINTANACRCGFNKSESPRESKNAVQSNSAFSKSRGDNDAVAYASFVNCHCRKNAAFANSDPTQPLIDPSLKTSAQNSPHDPPYKTYESIRRDSHTIPPPSHYLSSYDQKINLARAMAIESTFKPTSLRSFGFKSFLASSPFKTNTAPISTSLLPSIIGNHSKISRKMSQDSKVPFSPIDFLSDNGDGSS